MNIKPPPHNIDAEKAILGTLIQWPDSLLDILGFLKAEDFYAEAHSFIYQAMIDLTDAGRPVDLVTMASELEKNTLLAKVGGYSMLSRLSCASATSENIAYYAKLVKEASQRRHLMAAAQKIMSLAQNSSEDFSLIQEQAEEEIFRGNTGSKSRNLVFFRDVMPSALKSLEEFIANAKHPDAIPTGIPVMDHEDGGLLPGDLILVAGRPGMGKTALGNQMAAGMAVENHPVLYCCGEMEAKRIAMRVLCTMGEFAKRTERHRENSHAWDKMSRFATTFEGKPFAMIDGTMTLSRICAVARMAARFHGLKALYVDYIQLIKTAGKNRVVEVGEISRSLKELAQDLRIPVIAMSQLNREIDKRENYWPQNSDLKDSGSLEQDADIIVFPHRPHKDREDKEKSLMESAFLVFTKYRDASVGAKKIMWRPDITRFYPCDSRDDD